MAHLFINGTTDWLVAPLEQPLYALGAGSEPLLPAGSAAASATAAAILCRASDAARWALLPRRSAGVRVNGRAVIGGLRLLRDKDEIVINDTRLFFSTERLQRVEPYPDLGRPSVCPRCRTRLEVSLPAVCCPGCGSWCHARPERPCWTYDRTCPVCSYPTDIDTYTWTPAALNHP